MAEGRSLLYGGRTFVERLQVNTRTNSASAVEERAWRCAVQDCAPYAEPPDDSTVCTKARDLAQEYQP